MMLIDTFVAPSPIEGVGIFTAVDIGSGQAIWRFDPLFDIVLNAANVESLNTVQRQYLERYGYPHMRRPGMIVLESDNGRFMNHHEQPNTVFVDPDVGFAKRAIRAGEELTCNYAEFDPAFQIMPGRLFVNGGIAASVGNHWPLQP